MVPFVFLGVVATMAHGAGLFKGARTVVIWSAALVLIGLLPRGHEVKSQQLRVGASGEEERRVLEMIDDLGGVIAIHQTAPHVSHRKVIQFVYDPTDPLFKMPPDDQIDWVFLDFNEESVRSVEPFGTSILHKYKYHQSPEFREIYHQGSIFLFHRNPSRS